MKKLSFLIASTLILALVFKTRSANVPITHIDTVKPTYQKFLRYNNLSIPEYLYMNRIKDSIVNAYRQEMGDKTLRMYFEAEDYLRGRVVLDSVKIELPKK